MKKLVFTLIATLTFCGITMAQHPETHWPEFSGDPFDDQGSLCASIMIDGEPVTNTYQNWEMMEIAAFVGDQQRAANIFLTDYYGELFPTTEADPIYYTTPGEVVSFKMYNHATGILYEDCVTLIWNGDPITILTGEEHWEIFDDPDHPLMLSFSTPSFTKDITAYTEGQKDHYYLIASPIGTVSPEDVTNMLSNSYYDLYYFDQDGPDGKEWITYKSGDGATNPGFSLQPGKGYLYANSADVTLTFTGAPYNNGEVTLTKSSNSDIDFQGWNLVGNPFGQTAYITKSFYRMNEGGTEIVSAEGNSVECMEGIFVEAETNGEVLTFSKTATKGNEQIVLNVTRNNRGAAIDRAIVRFNQENGLPKFQLNPNNTKVYIPQNDKDYAVVHADSQGELPVNFKASKNGTYTFSVTTEEVDVNYLHLIDNLTGADIDLKATPSYTFEARATDYVSRFKLVFTVDRATDEVFAFFSNGNWVINNDGKAVLQVIDITGRILSNEQISGNVNKHIDAAPGVYVMRLINGDNVKTQKIVVSK